MPYEGEFAHYRPLRRVAEADRVRKLLKSCKVLTNTGSPLMPPTTLSLDPSDWTPTWVVAIDGSHLEIPVENGFPGAEVSYVTIASVLINLESIKKLDTNRPVNPVDFRKTEEAESIDSALPGCNVVMEGEPSASASLRKALFEVFDTTRMAPESETLLDTYEALLQYKPITSHEQKCPYEDCSSSVKEYTRGRGEYTCSCPRKYPLYSTDALRIHEGMQPAGSNGAMFAEIMQVWERIWTIHILRTLEAKGWLSILRRLAFVLDGPLAVFGHPAWLSQAIYEEIKRINKTVRKATRGQDILLIGVEKTGIFVEHLANLNQDKHGQTDVYPSQSVMLLIDSYIKRNIIFSDSAKPYGEDTYFGRKFFYKTKSGALIVVSLPFLEDGHRDLSTADVSQYPRLADTLSILDQLVSSRYPNSLTPLVSAHAEAAIPLNIGNHVLERLAKELITEEST